MPKHESKSNGDYTINLKPISFGDWLQFTRTIKDNTSTEDFIVAAFDTFVASISVGDTDVAIMDLPPDLALGIALEARELSRPKVPPSLIGPPTGETEEQEDGE